MHWINAAAIRADLPAAAQLSIGRGASTAAAWDTASRALGFTPSELAIRLAPVLGVRVADLDAGEARALTLLPERLARRYNVFPLRENDRTITVATSDPTDLDTEQAMSFASGRQARFELAPPHKLAEAINLGYSADRAVEKLLSSVDSQIADAVRLVEDAPTAGVTAEEIAAGPVVKLTSLIIRDAVMLGASDAHLEPGPKGATVRLRIDGVMRVHMHLPTAAMTRVVSRIKVMSKLDISDRLRPQDGRARVSVEGRTYDLRISTVPTRDAEKAVIRVLRPDTATSLATAKLPPAQLALFRQLLGARDGIVLVTGPTGSGKTTTLYAALRELAETNVNIITVEDPVEYELGKITQMQVDSKRGITFASALRAILRQDPDVIFVGEIRDLETAEVAVQAALTGHLVLATMHTNDAIGAVARLHDLGLDRASIAASLRGAVAQRLVRTLCGECAVPVKGTLTEEEFRLATSFGTQPTLRAVGCTACGNTGYRGRMPIIEVATVTSALGEMITAGASNSALRRASGMQTLRDVGLQCVQLGLTTLQEVERVIGEGSADQVAAEPEPMVSAPVATIDSAPATSPRILIVDDDPVMRLLATRILQTAGYQVEAVTDGVEAIGALRVPNHIQLVVTDLQMPILGGAGLLQALRVSPDNSSLPVIVMTGSDEEADEVALMDAGADDYIRKPIDAERFVSRVRAALRRANS